MAKAFISHASQDREVAERICSFLEERGVRCWIAPRDVRPGRKYGEEIVDGIQGADAVVLVLTENANTSTFVEREIERAVSYGKPTLPVRVREVQPSRSLELFISNAHWIDAWKPPMEQYLDRLADSIRSLSPGGAARAETKRRRMQIGWRGKRLAKRIAIGAAILLLISVGALVTWWLLGRQANTTSPVASAPAPSATIPPRAVITPEPKVESTPERNIAEAKRSTTPQPTVTTPSPVQLAEASPTPFEQTRKPVESSPTEVHSPASTSSSVSEVLSTLGNTTGRTRDAAIDNNIQRLPPQITVDELMAITEGTAERNRLIALMATRLTNPIKTEDALKILGVTNGRPRSELIAALRPRLPQSLSVKELLALIEAAYGRNALIQDLMKRLPNPLSIEETMQILDETSGRDRSGLIEMLGARMPQTLTVKQLLAMIENAYDRSGVIRQLLSRLPNPLSLEETLEVLGSTTGRERFGLIEMLAPRMPRSLSSKDMLSLIENTYDRNGAIKLLASRLPNPLSFEDLRNILASTTGRERHGLIEILHSRVPAGLSPAEVSTLAEGSYDPAGTQKLIRH